MAFLTLEAHVSEDNWVLIGTLRPGDPIGSMSDNKPDGTRDVYMFECLSDGSKSIIYRSKAGIDAEEGSLRVITTKGTEVIKELGIGDEPYLMTIKTDKSPEPRLIRFTYTE